MNKAVMISIHPKWCELIENGKKTIEVRKTKPKLEMPFKVYIYCTKSGGIRYNWIGDVWNGKVIGEFVCDRITQYNCDRDYKEYFVAGYVGAYMPTQEMCLTQQDLVEYGQGETLYGWHISNLVIYDKPKEWDEFMHYKYFDWWDYGHHENKRQRELCNLTRPPQSWCYLEEQK